jgi:hypothetical protein
MEAAKPIAVFLWVIGLLLLAIGMAGSANDDSQGWIKVPGVIIGTSIEKKVIRQGFVTFTSRHSVTYDYNDTSYSCIIDWGSEETRGLMGLKFTDFLRTWDGTLFISREDYSKARLSLEEETLFRNLIFSGGGVLLLAVILTLMVIVRSSLTDRKLVG